MFRWHFDTMGTVASIVTETEVDAALQAEVQAICEGFDQRFSLYRPDSELSRVNNGVLKLSEGSAELLAAYALAIDWSLATGGVFTPERPDGLLDLNGVVKALAIRAVVDLLSEPVSAGHVGIGGDGEAWGRASVPWQAGIVDPNNREQLISTVTLGEGGDGRARWALATSGSSERGDHIWSRPGDVPLAQASVLAPDIVTADVLATTLVAAGPSALDAVAAACDCEAFLVLTDGSQLATAGWTNPAR